MDHGKKALKASAKAMGASLTTVSVDDADVQRLGRLIESSFVNAPPAEGERWRDQGWWLLFPLAMILLTFFRRGGAVAIQNFFENLAMLLASAAYAMVAGVGVDAVATMIGLGVLVVIATMIVSWHLPRDTGELSIANMVEPLPAALASRR